MLGREAQVLLVNLCQVMAVKMEELVLLMHGWVDGQIAITVMRSYYCMIRGAYLLSSLRYRRPD